MKHLNPVSVPRDRIPARAQDGARDIFLQVWAYVFFSILFGALGLKR